MIPQTNSIHSSLEMDSLKHFCGLSSVSEPPQSIEPGKISLGNGRKNGSTYCVFKVDGAFEFTQQLDNLDVPASSWKGVKQNKRN